MPLSLIVSPGPLADPSREDSKDAVASRSNSSARNCVSEEKHVGLAQERERGGWLLEACFGASEASTKEMK
jgi:hypothetical protein